MRRNGFSLLELLVVLVIVGILAGVALPGYLEHIVRARLTEAFDALAVYHIRMEQTYQDAGSYANSANACALIMSATEHFNYQCQLTNSGQGYLITATANGTHNLSGYSYIIDQSGTRSTSAFPAAANLPKACWLTQAGGC
ncbi:MAG: pilE [Gammaproteobacteria bacterium]|jgi:type IV pilus assembly protein PilE|nr:pilE [Gammaproteobacteria bacterium]